MYCSRCQKELTRTETGYSCSCGFSFIEKHEVKIDLNDIEKRSKSEISKMLKDISNNDDLRIKFVDFMNKFHNYSMLNNFWMFFQAQFSNIDLSMVKGKKQWLKDFNRVVKSNAIPFHILAPRIWKKEVLDKQTEEVKTVSRLYFNVVQVFDYSQTDGDPIDFPSYRALVCDNPEQKLSEFVKKISEKYPVSFKSMNIETGGYTDGTNIVLNSLRPVNSQLMTLFHEYGHAVLDHAKKRAEITVKEREVEAELVSFLVCMKIGVPRGSEDYINHFGGLTDQSINTAIITSQKIIKELGI